MDSAGNMSKLRIEETLKFEDVTFFDVTDDCIVPSLKQVLPKVGFLLLSNIGFNLLTHFWDISNFVFHGISTILGVVLLHLTVPDVNIWELLGWLCFIYSVLFFSYKYKLNIEFITGTICILFLLHGELLSVDLDQWMQARGIYMIAIMKIISLAVDVQQGMELPSAIAFAGYIWCPSNVIFGPWVSYKDYFTIHTRPNKKNTKWLVRIMHTVMISIFFLTYSNCWGSYLLPDGYNRWFVAFRQAQAFRASHYFISYLSEAAMVTAGYNCEKNRGKDTPWGYYVTNPLKIEFPSSLSNVVVSWNIPMHHFLKRYVYRPVAQYGQFKGILVTYFVSSLLHGFNMEIAAVLLSIGVYSYIQAKFQEKLSKFFNACLGIRPCKMCQHRYTSKDSCVWFARIVFSLITIFSLLYLGVLMDFSDYPYPRSIQQKWAELDYMGHWLMLFMYIVYLVLF